MATARFRNTSFNTSLFIIPPKNTLSEKEYTHLQGEAKNLEMDLLEMPTDNVPAYISSHSPNTDCFQRIFLKKDCHLGNLVFAQSRGCIITLESDGYRVDRVSALHILNEGIEQSLLRYNRRHGGRLPASLSGQRSPSPCSPLSRLSSPSLFSISNVGEKVACNDSPDDESHLVPAGRP